MLFLLWNAFVDPGVDGLLIGFLGDPFLTTYGVLVCLFFRGELFPW